MMSLTSRGNLGMATRVLKEEIRPFFQLSEDKMDQSLRRVQLYNEFASLLTTDNFRDDSYFLIQSLIFKKAFKYHLVREWIRNKKARFSPHCHLSS
jgi:hypothetical protein